MASSPCEHAALTLLDGGLRPETRQVAAEDETVAVFIESVLFAHPLTRGSDLAGALAAALEDAACSGVPDALEVLSEWAAPFRRGATNLPAETPEMRGSPVFRLFPNGFIYDARTRRYVAPAQLAEWILRHRWVVRVKDVDSADGAPQVLALCPPQPALIEG